MRTSTLRHHKIVGQHRRGTRRPVGVAAALGALAILGVSCSKDRVELQAVAASKDVAATPAMQPLSAVVTPQNEVAGGAAPVMRKAADEKSLGGRSEVSFAATATGVGMPAAGAVTAPASTGAMIIRTGNAGVEVDSLDVAIGRVRTLALRVNGFVANTTIQGGRDQLRSASLELKVPSERFDDAIAGLSPIGKVESVNVSAEDVGEEYVDIAARVENAHRLEARIIDLLANRTGKLQDVLSVEHELARVREEIERYEGRLRYLKTRASVSTLTIAVHERAPVIVPVAGDGPILVAFRQAWENFVGVVAAFIASLGVLIPLGVVIFFAWLGVRRYIPWRPSGGTPPAAGAVTGD